MKKRKISYTFILLASAIILQAVSLNVAALPAAFQEELPVPAAPSSWVSDYAGIFSEGERNSLEQKLNEFEYRTSTQIFVVTLSDNGGYPADALAPLIGERWSVGQSGKDNGIVILVDMQDRDMFIATGYGNEEFVTDATAGLIVRNEIIPQFKQGNYYEGIYGATDVLISLLDGKFTSDEYRKQSSSAGGVSIGGIVFMIILFSVLFGGRGRRSTGMGRSNLPLWLALGMMSGGGRHSGSWGSFSGGGGGGGFGGFSGGGGGSFGGGGAGGSW